MTYGLLIRYKVGRPLTSREIAEHIPQQKRTCSPPNDHRTVIRMNSTYLECVDKFFKDKGMMTFVGLVGLYMTPSSFEFLFKEFQEWGTSSFGSQLADLLFATLLTLVFLLCAWLVWAELFRRTHYPIRFNRKTRKVHAFRTNGTIITADWDKIYFTPWHPAAGTEFNGSEILGHVMAEDGKTVIDTFGMPFESTYLHGVRDSIFFSQFEFVRRYMEEPDELHSLTASIQEVQDIVDRRESWWQGLDNQLKGNFGNSPIRFAFAPIGVFFACGRLLANFTSRIPRWPEDIEAQCQIDPDDPYVVDAERLREKRLDEIYADMPLDEPAQNTAKNPRAE